MLVAFLWVALNKDGRTVLRKRLRTAGTELKNGFISKLFLTRTGKRLKLKGTIQEKLSAVKENMKLKGPDYEQLMTVLSPHY